MNPTLRAAINAGIAAITRDLDPPTEPLGYGSDLSCTTDLDPRMPEVSGRAMLGQALARRLDCPRGILPDDPNYGIDIRSFLNRGVTRAGLVALSSAVRNEMEADDRVDTATVTGSISSDGVSVSLQIRIRPIDESVGGFSLIVSVTDGGRLLEVTVQ